MKTPFSPAQTFIQAFQELHILNLKSLEGLLISKLQKLMIRWVERVWTVLNNEDFPNRFEQEQLKKELSHLRAELTDKSNWLEHLEQEFQITKEHSKTYQVAIHELKTPLTSIIGFTELLLNTSDAIDESQRQLLERIHSNGRKQLETIDSLMDRMLGNTLNVSAEPIKLSQMLDEVEMTFRIMASDKELEFIVHRGASLPEHIVTDYSKITSILNNLLTNAVKYTDQGHIYLTVTKLSNDQICFDVSDSGRGIDQSDLPYLFHYFYRGNNTERERGYGFGLALSAEMANLLKGRLQAESAGPGQGSRFKLIIPIEYVGK